MKQITSRRWELIKEEVQKGVSEIPSSRNRVKAAREASLYYKALEASDKKSKVEVELKSGKEYKFVVAESVNLGTKKWSDFVTEYRLEKMKYARETNDFYVFLSGYGREYKLAKHKVVCVIK